MGRNLSSHQVGSVVESNVRPLGAIEADGEVFLQSALKPIYDMVGDQDLQFDQSKVFSSGANSQGIWNAPDSQSGFYADFQTDGTQFVYTNGSFIFVSPDATKWKPVAIVPQGLNANTHSVINKLKYRSGVWFAYCAGLANYGYLTSTDGVVWTRVATPMVFNDMAWDGTNFMFVSGLTSYFGTSLTSLTTAVLGASCKYVEKIGTNFVAWDAGTGTTIYVGTGASWATQSTGQALGSRYSIANANLFIARYSDATSRPLYVASANGTAWFSSGSSASDAGLVVSPTCVVWDGTAYTMGERAASNSGSVIRRFTTITGAASDLISTVDTYQTGYSGALIAYKTGVYAFVWDYQAATMYVTTAAPSGNWALRESYASGTAYPFFPNHGYCVLGVTDTASTRKGMITAHNLNSAGSAAQYAHIFLEDSTGYFTPYKTTNFWSLGYSSATPAVLSLAIATDGNNLMMTYTTGQAIFVFNANHTTKTLVSRNVGALAAAIIGSIPTKNQFLIFGGYSSVNTVSAIKFDGSVTTSHPGWTIGQTSLYGVSWNRNNGCIMVTAVVSSAYYVLTSWDGMTWLTEPVPLIYTEAGVAVAALQNNYKIWHNGVEFALVASTGFAYRGKSTRRLTADSSIVGLYQGANGMLTVLDQFRTVNCDNSSSYLVDSRGGMVLLGSASNTVTQTVTYTYSWGTLFSHIPSSAVPVVSAVVNLIGTPTTTHFKLPTITPSVPSKTAYILV